MSTPSKSADASLAGRVVRRARAALGGTSASPAPGVGGPVWSERAQRTVDALMTAIATDDHDGVRRLLGDETEVIVNGRAGRGPDGVAALLEAMPSHAGLRQRTGDVFPAVPTFTVVTSYVDQTGDRSVDEVVVVTPAGEAVRRLVYYVVGS